MVLGNETMTDTTLTQKGFDFQDLKQRNKLLVLKMIATVPGISRVEIAAQTGLSKMTVGKLVSELLDENLVVEYFDKQFSEKGSLGRKPIQLKISPNSPYICGILIKRYYVQIILSNLCGSILASTKASIPQLNSNELLELIYDKYISLTSRITHPVKYIGISSIGPVDSNKGIILDPPFFFDIYNLDIVDWFHRKTKLPVYLLPDSSAGALAEQLYGIGKDIPNYLYLHIWNGIGAGLILNGKLFNGNSGKAGEIGHTSINYAGPVCECGNRGCLDLYANEQALCHSAKKLLPLNRSSELAKQPTINWNQILSAAENGDGVALIAIQEFCSYVSISLSNALRLLDISTVIVGYTNPGKGHIIEDMLRLQIRDILHNESVCVLSSSFGDEAPLIGSIAMIAERIFSGALPYK